MNRFILIDITKIKQVESCHALFLHARLKIHLQGSIRLRITSLAVSSDEPSSICPEDDEEPDCKNITMTGYNNTISCSLPIWPGQCRLDFEPNCNASLGYREVTYDCSLEPMTSKTLMILYPLDMYELHIKNNNITWLAEYSFTSLNNLNALYLEVNLLTMLSNSVFENLSKLQILSLHDNKISYLEEKVFQALEYLSELYLNRNQLVSLPTGMFKNCGRLIFLDLEENKLTSLSQTLFNGLQGMLLLSLVDNQIQSLDVNTLKNVRSLWYLYLNENKLKYLPVGIFQELKLLQFLSLSDNQIVSLDANIFKNLTMLTMLYISGNELKTLPAGIFDELKFLQFLSLSDNQIMSLDANIFKNLTMLTKLYVAGNVLQIVPTGMLEELKILQYVSLSRNQIVSLDASTFRNTSMLLYLNLDENELKTLPTSLFEELKWIQTLGLRKNQIILLDDDTFKGLKNLRELHLSQNLLRNISSRLFRDLRNLLFLFLYENQLTLIQAGALHHANLYGLWLQKNQLLNLDKDLFGGSSRLDVLSLNTNGMKHVAVGLFNKLVKLQLLILSDNQISHLNGDVFQGLYQIKLLDMMNNMLVALPQTLFRNLTFLESIFLTGNQLKKLETDLFQGLINLKSLYLNFNKFARFDFDVLKHAINLKDVILNNNTIYSMVNMPNGSQLEYLNLRQNPLTRITSQTLLFLSKEADLLVSQHEICECYASNREQCSAENERSPYLTCDRLMSDRVLLAMMWLIGLGALSGNSFVLIWRRKVAQKNKVQDFLLSNLAVADFLMGIYMIGIASADIYFGNYFPMQSETWRSGITCRILGGISITSSEASVFFVTLISFDRFLSIRFPYSIKKIGRKSVVLVATIVWIISLTLGVVPSVLSGTNFKFYDNSHVCIGLPLALTKIYATNEGRQLSPFQEGYQVQNERVIFTTEFKGEVTGMYFSSAVFLGLNCLCYFFIVVCYFEIVRAVQRSSKESGRTREMKEQIRLTLRVGMIVATDFLCWFPVIILGILVQTRILTLPPSVYAWCITFVLPFNSAINPYLYTISDIASNHKAQK